MTDDRFRLLPALAILAAIVVIVPSAQVSVRAASGLPPAMQQAVGQAQDTAQPLWDEVPWQTQQEILALVQQRL
ncbi:MAG TPA: hypothetical protein VHI93_03050, partial [Candidatus Thermoplasmatota archaeon]|nr:hypothetical protein [Candidatus Thermoplasmatota archaeon]